MDAPTFSTTRLAEGYDIAEVDEFVTEVMKRLERGQTKGLDRLIIAKRFQSTRFRRGYNQDEVDDHLDALASQACAMPTNHQSTTKLPDAYDYERVRPLLSVAWRAPRGARFDRATLRHEGYHPDDVDDFIDSLRSQRYTGESLRQAVFRSKRRGYDEDKVDAWIEQLISFLGT